MSDDRTSENGFEASVHEVFDFLSSDCGFRCVASKPDIVRYESPSVYFEIGYSVNHDNEVYARFGRINVPGVQPGELVECLDFGPFLAVADPVEYAAIRHSVPYYIAHTELQVRIVLSHYARGLRRYGPLLSGDEAVYARAREL